MKRLPESEEIIMAAVWSTDEALSFRDIIDLANEISGKNWKPQTVTTLLSRLRERQFLAVPKRGYYTALIDKQQYVRYVCQTLADRFYKGDAGKLRAEVNDFVK